MKSLDQIIAEQTTIDTTKNAPVASPKQVAASKAKSGAKPSAKKVAAHGAINFIVRGDGATKLFAHTAAWLELSGLMSGGSYPVELVKELGGSAFNYHFKQGNFEQSQGMATLTMKGLNKFAARSDTGAGGHGAYLKEDKDHYVQMMITGLNDDRLIKSEHSIRAINPA
jgi:hypothetical protein